MLTIDGSMGEGGGQILRTALTLSLVTGTPFRLERLRVRRPKPGLLRQHLTAVQAATIIGQGQVEGAALGSQTLVFFPGQVAPGDYHFAVGSAGSATLVLQTVLPALWTAARPTRLRLEGGTHNPHAPPVDFLARTFLPLLARMGPRVTATLDRHGFYPAGGGEFHAAIKPSAQLARLDLLERGAVRSQCGRVLIAGLPRQIAERQARVVSKQMGWLEDQVTIETIAASSGPGNVVLLEIASDQLTEIFTGFGQKDLRAEAVAERATAAARQYLAAGVPVGERLADQLLLPLALGGGGSFKTLPLSSHTRTNLEVIRRLLDVRITVEQADAQAWIVTVGR